MLFFVAHEVSCKYFAHGQTTSILFHILAHEPSKPTYIATPTYLPTYLPTLLPTPTPLNPPLHHYYTHVSSDFSVILIYLELFGNLSSVRIKDYYKGAREMGAAARPIVVRKKMISYLFCYYCFRTVHSPLSCSVVGTDLRIIAFRQNTCLHQSHRRLFCNQLNWPR